MTAARAVLADEVEVPPALLDPLRILGKAEAEHRSVDRSELEHLLLGDHLREWPVRRLLPGNRARPDELEAAVDPHSAGGRVGGDAAVDLGEQPVMVDRSLQVELDR